MNISALAPERLFSHTPNRCVHETAFLTILSMRIRCSGVALFVFALSVSDAQGDATYWYLQVFVGDGLQAAKLSFEEDVKGTLEVGKYADLTILSGE